METMDFLKGALLVCKKMFGDEFENLSKEEKRAVVMKVLNDTLKQNPILITIRNCYNINKLILRICRCNSIQSVSVLNC